MYLAAPNSAGSFFGAVGAGGLAVFLTIVLIFGVVGKGKVKLKTWQAGVVALAAGSAYTAAGKIWSHAETVVQQGWTGLGVGNSGGAFGDIQIGGASLALAGLMLFAPLNPARAAALCMIAAMTWPAAGDGSIWAVPGQLTAALFTMFGV
ncbi:hypothetical protein ACFV6Z_18610 [Streptomyces sp. NPDC059818]|uniref:hypothetical protein n=1 Tax=Streptomyces sp. NPDC059818 TaxID=3346962 RepID=UPI003669BB45